jgi:hypothetical protein
MPAFVAPIVLRDRALLRGRSPPAAWPRRGAYCRAALSAPSGVDADLNGPPTASGAFGDVFFGSLRGCGTPVVLKRARPDAGRAGANLLRAERNVSSGLAAAQHHRWPRFLGDVEWRSRRYVMYERVGEETLEDFVSGKPQAALRSAIGASSSLSIGYCARLDVATFRIVVRELLTTLAELNARGYVHRDIKVRLPLSYPTYRGGSLPASFLSPIPISVPGLASHCYNCVSVSAAVEFFITAAACSLLVPAACKYHHQQKSDDRESAAADRFRKCSRNSHLCLLAPCPNPRPSVRSARAPPQPALPRPL